MVDKTNKDNKKSVSADWLVQGVLTKLGDTFDRLTGRGWNPSSGLATSKLTEKLKTLLDSEVRDLGKHGKFVPHNIKLKIQWGKFSTDSEKDLQKLQHELHASAIDHINDRLYHTYAPISIEIQTDYFTEGVRLLGSFGRYAENDEEEAEVNVTVPGFGAEQSSKNGRISVVLNEEEVERNLSTFNAVFVEKGKERTTVLDFKANKRISVGRSKENGLDINDGSVSKIHASLVLGANKELLVADTGSTNGTFVGGTRIAYGKAIPAAENSEIKFGTVSVKFMRVGKMTGGQDEHAALPTEPSADIGPEDLKNQPAPTEVIEAVENKEPVFGGDSISSEVPSLESEDRTSANEEIDLHEISQAEDGPTSKGGLDKTQDWEI
ncbi:MAG: FHA domain-containing protein [Pyrinomonadaceae bacterium]